MLAEYQRCSGSTILEVKPGSDQLLIYYKGLMIARFNTSIIKKLLGVSNEGSGPATDPDRSISASDLLRDK